MATFLFGGSQLSDPAGLYQECVRLGLDTSWYGKANSFRCPLGTEPGRGYLLMLRSVLTTLGTATLRDLVITTQGQAVEAPDGLPPGFQETLTLKNLLIVCYHSLTPGLRDDPNEALLVEVADRRYQLRGIPINVGYNLPSDSSGNYHAATLNGGVTPYTWAEVGQALWEAVGTSHLGTWPGLPYTPDATPQNLQYYGMSAWEALGRFLARIGCAAAYNPIGDTFSIVRVGADDAALELWLQEWDAFRVDDAYPGEGARANIPESIRVLFRKLPRQLGSSAFYAVDVATSTTYLDTSAALSGTVHHIHDDLLALYDDTPALTNSAALATRAAERAEEYSRQLGAGLDPLRPRFALGCADVRCLPGAQVVWTEWADHGTGLTTEVCRDLSLVAPGVGLVWSDPDGGGINVNGGTVNYYNSTVNYNNSAVYFPHYTYTQFTTNITNWTLSAGNVRIRVSTDEHFREIRSIVPGTSPSGRIVCIHNVGLYVILIPDSDSGSTAANRILTTTGNAYWLAPGHCVCLVYDATSERWRVSENSDERLEGVLDYADPGGDMDDYELFPQIAQHRFEPSANIDVTGFAFGQPGLRHRIINGSDTYTMTFKHSDGASQTPNRIRLPDGVDLPLPPHASFEIDYDGTDLCWRPLGICCGDGGGEPAPEQDLFSTIAVDGQDPIIADDPSDTLTIVAGAGVELLTDAATDTLTINITSAGDPPPYVARWVKITKTYADLATAATTNEIALFTVPAGGVVHDVIVHHTAAFTGGTLNAYSVSVGKPASGASDDFWYVTYSDVFSAPSGAPNAFNDGHGNIPQKNIYLESFSGSFNIAMYALCSGALLNAATQGSVDVYLSISIPLDAPDEFGGGGGPLAHNAFATVQTPGGADSATAGSPASVVTFEGDSVIGVGVVQDGDNATVTLSYIPPAFAGDASDVTYTPLTSGDWDSPGDPGNVDDALDELASRVEGIEGLSYVENLNDLGDVVITTPSTGQLLRHNGTNWVNATVTAGGDFSGPASSVDGVAVVFDGTTGKLGKQATGTGVAKLASGVLSAGTVSFAEMQTVSTDILLGNDAAGTAVQEITCTAAGRALLDDADAAAQRTTLGLGTLATQSGTFAATPSGTVAMFAAASAPSGWLLCDGSAVSRSTYADLFTAIGTTWGVGDGSTTFNVPDMRGRAPIGVGTGSGLTSRSLAASGGAETHVLTEAEMPAHTHGPTSGAAEIWQRNFGGGLDVNIAIGGGAQDGARAVTSVTGSSNAHANMQPWRALNFIIKT